MVHLHSNLVIIEGPDRYQRCYLMVVHGRNRCKHVSNDSSVPGIPGRKWNTVQDNMETVWRDVGTLNIRDVDEGLILV